MKHGQLSSRDAGCGRPDALPDQGRNEKEAPVNNQGFRVVGATGIEPVSHAV